VGPAARALEFLRALTEAGASEQVGVPTGTLLRSPDERYAYVGNQLLLDHSADLGADELLALLDDLQAGLTHRRAYVHDEAQGARLHRAIAPHGWGGGAEVVLVLPDDVALSPTSAIAVPDARLRALERRTNMELGLPGLVADQLAVIRRRAATKLAAQGFVVTAPDGTDVAHATLYGGAGAVAQIEDVGTLLDHRGRGYGKDVVAACAAQARARGAEVIFLTADEQDWPQHLYRGMGFVPVARTWVLQREAVELS